MPKCVSVPSRKWLSFPAFLCGFDALEKDCRKFVCLLCKRGQLGCWFDHICSQNDLDPYFRFPQFLECYLEFVNEIGFGFGAL